MPASLPIIILGSQLIMTVADRVPSYDIVRNCKLDLAAAAGLVLDQSVKSCVNDEQNARQQLQKQWSTFPASNRKSCATEENIGGTPSYVSLLTCLQMPGWAK